MIARLRASTFPFAMLAPFIGVFAVFLVYPLVQAIVLASHQTFGPEYSRFVGLDNFRFLFTDPLFYTAMRNTFLFAAGSLFIQLPVSLALALALNRARLKGRALYRLIYFSPSLVGTVFAGAMFALIFQKETGPLNASLHTLFGFNAEFAWLDHYVMSALILAALWLYAGFNMIYFLAALQNVPRDLVEAATVDGASAWHRFRHVTIPTIVPVAGFVVLMSFIGSMQLFELPWVMLNGPGPENRGLTIVMYLYQTGFETGDLGYASAIGWVLAVILLAAGAAQRTLARGEHD
jgi:ABC-type sugar transport system permease subunit